MTDRSTFERRLQAAFDAYADEVGVEVDAAALAGSVARTRRTGIFRSHDGRSLNRWLTPVLIGLLLLGALAASFWLGSQFVQDPRRPLSELITPTPVPHTPDITDTPAPTVVSATDTPRPTTSGGFGADGPCAPMLQLLSTYVTDAGTGLPTIDPERRALPGEVLMTARNALGTAVVTRLDVGTGAPVPVTLETRPNAVFPSIGGMPIAPLGGIYASRDGRAVAVEEGDFGLAGCGDPLIGLADGGRIRPFEAGVFQRISTLAWADDGSALYGVSRPTTVPRDEAMFDSGDVALNGGPGRLLRWDSATGEVTDLGSPCEGCFLGRPVVSPDGRRIALQPFHDHVSNEIALSEEGSWRTITYDDSIGSGPTGWLDDTSMLVGSTGVIDLQGNTLRRWDQPCCHGTGYSGLLSPDRSTMAGITLSSDFYSFSLTLLDVADGSSRQIWTVPDVRGCSAFEEGSSGRADCDAAHPELPGPDAISGYSTTVAWSPDGASILVFDAAGDAVPGEDPSSVDNSRGWLIVVKTDGSGTTGRTRIDVPPMVGPMYGARGPAVAWLP